MAALSSRATGCIIWYRFICKGQAEAYQYVRRLEISMYNPITALGHSTEK
jgi:hypothetical protein